MCRNFSKGPPYEPFHSWKNDLAWIHPRFRRSPYTTHPVTGCDTCNADSGLPLSETCNQPFTPIGATDLLSLTLATCERIALAHGTARPTNLTPNAPP